MDKVQLTIFKRAGNPLQVEHRHGARFKGGAFGGSKRDQRRRERRQGKQQVDD